ncbi:major facilitator superfamily domain-containing protein [Suillus lakei]|nr:major facilitator superfamily domain-containing protein [Suillus lakei]
MSEKSLCVETFRLRDMDSASYRLSYDWQKTRVAVDQEMPGELASHHKLSIHTGEAPDGGLRAWLMVFAAALVVFSTFGFINSWGVFQAYYEENLLLHTSPSTIAWIGSTQNALAHLPALAAGRLFDLGYLKIPFFAASSVLVACTFLTSECTQSWQFFLTQGIGVGVCSGMFCPIVVIQVVSHWFSKRRGLALSTAAVGAALGSVVFPVAAQNLIPFIGYGWTVHVFGLILMVTLGAANLDSPPGHMYLCTLHLSLQWDKWKMRGVEWGCSCLSLLLEALQVLQYQAPSVPRQEGSLLQVIIQ